MRSNVPALWPVREEKTVIVVLFRFFLLLPGSVIILYPLLAITHVGYCCVHYVMLSFFFFILSTVLSESRKFVEGLSNDWLETMNFSTFSLSEIVTRYVLHPSTLEGKKISLVCFLMLISLI